MKLYLSSYRIPDPKAFAEFVGKKPSEIKFALILNAKDDKTEEVRKEKRDGLLEYFLGLGFQVEEINLLNGETEEALKKKLSAFDVLWFNGGNTFCLRWAVEKSGVTQVLKDLLDRGIVYGGDSAGAILAGPTLKHYDAADDPSASPEAIYEGLGYVDFAVVPHWGSEDFGHVVEAVEKKLQDDGYKTVRLADNEYLLIENGRILNQVTKAQIPTPKP